MEAGAHVVLHLRTSAGVTHLAVPRERMEVRTVVTVDGRPVRGDLMSWTDARDAEDANEIIRRLSLQAAYARRVRALLRNPTGAHQPVNPPMRQLVAHDRRRQRIQRLARYLDRVVK